MPQPSTSIPGDAYTQITERNFQGQESQLPFEPHGQTYDEIDNTVGSIVVKARDIEPDVVKQYAAAAHTIHSTDISDMPDMSLGFQDEPDTIKQRYKPSGIDREITDLLHRSKWEGDLEQALDSFYSVHALDDPDPERIEEQAKELAIEFDSAPQEAIPLSVFQAVPEFAQHVDSELQNKLKERLLDFCEPVTYQSNAEEGSEEPLTWAELAEERDKYFEELKSYFDRVEGRDASVEERKRHMLKVFYAYQSDDIIVED